MSNTPTSESELQKSRAVAGEEICKRIVYKIAAVEREIQSLKDYVATLLTAFRMVQEDEDKNAPTAS
jgi:hypothetical protein